ncbi:CheR family methyltransferase [Deinococcus deserti]|uniref:Putative PAS:CheB methylesterase:MCP methyltransferase, CheR-type n=1 Tax=Deinococcus deserti (strain DSM 17065 / CIP 109153 / LMG 22923 / VCD115) TaxID=546414 RepID=C1CZ44_DEIDV|nr:CheR family methyltransferase [Deinococcus deserti]ACO45082.1 putative PAS:CheB methylesterase:MCP methyltransferase, CheR-type [Deinococcus deserti VCD115]
MNEDAHTATDFPEAPAESRFRTPTAIVGIGGSAGALDSYERLFTALAQGSGMAFVVVPHLDPQSGSLMPELLARCTSLPVVEITDGLEAAAEHVYVAPPGHTVTLLRGALQLTPDPQPHLPIDTFFASLAADQGERAVAVVLSGMGIDGSRGVQAIKQNLGLVYVQDPATAQYASMPQSAVATGTADQVLPAEELAAELFAQVTRTQTLRYPEAFASDGRASASLQKVLNQVRVRTSHDFSQYKLNTLVRRIDRRMKSQQIQDLEQYAHVLRDNPEEVRALFRDFLINVTSFFRDPQAFEMVAAHLRTYMREHAESGSFRIWVAGCSTGEEAYSLAMLLREVLEETEDLSHVGVQIFATDLDQEAVDTARLGLYSTQAVAGVSTERLDRFFIARDGGYQVRSELREMIVFARHNVFRDPPFTRLDLVSCRNMLIYFSPELQKEVLPLFHFALKPGGLLFLGPSETLGTSREMFGTLDNRWKLYRREGFRPAGTLALANLSQTPLTIEPQRTSREHHLRFQPARPRESSVSSSVQTVLLAEWTPPAVAVDAQGTVVYVSGRTGAYLELPNGVPNNNVVDMAFPELRYELIGALREAVATDSEVRSPVLDFTVQCTPHQLELVVTPMRYPGQPQDLFLIVFLDRGQAPLQSLASAGPDTSGRVAQLERELQRTKEYLQATIEETEVALEERKSTNEELQTTNEELQSSIEELMTSKEELQSLNEELSTINAEHHVIITDLQQANDDMKNLLDSVGIATVFLDNNLRVKRFTPRITEVVSLMSVDLGRPITDIASNLRYDILAEDIQRVIQTLIPYETEVQTKDGRWFLMRISPYRTFDNTIDGAVVVFTNIDTVKQLHHQLRDAQDQNEAVLNTMSDPVVVLDHNLRVLSHNKALLELLQLQVADAKGVRLFDLGSGQFDNPELTGLLRDLTLGSGELSDFMLHMDLPGQGRRIVKVNARPLQTHDERAELLLWAEDVTPIIQQLAEEGPGAIHETTSSEADSGAQAPDQN